MNHADEENRDEDRPLVDTFLKDRCESSFRRLYRRHTPRMLRLAFHLGDGGSASPEDIVQEAWTRAVRALDGFAWRSSLATWLGGFVVNVGREFRRSAGPKSAIVRDEAGAFEAGWTDPLSMMALADALRELPEGFRSVLALHDLGGFTHAEIAGMLGIEPGTSKSQLARARRRLRARLGVENGKNRDEE